MNIGMWIVVIVGGAAGALSSLYCLLALPAVIIWKIYRRVFHGIPLNM